MRQGRNRRTPGLTQRAGIWHIDKRVRGLGRLCESTGCSSLEDAEAYLAQRLEELRRQRLYGEQPRPTWRQAATKYLEEYIDKPSIGQDALALDRLDPWIGTLPIDEVHLDALTPYVQHRRAEGKKWSTVNRDLAVVRRILNLSARVWRDGNRPWLATAPLLPMFKLSDKRPPYPLSWAEQRYLFPYLPGHLQRMALFGVNTGCREEEVCKLRWDWECKVPELKTSVFILPGSITKNSEERVVVLNRVARRVIDAQRGKDDDWVFPYKEAPIERMNNTAWRTARRKAAADYPEHHNGAACPAGLASVRVHDLRHTFGRRLRSAGVSLEDRQDLLGHKSGRVTTHYSAAELANLIAAVERVATHTSRKTPELTLLRVREKAVSA